MNDQQIRERLLSLGAYRSPFDIPAEELARIRAFLSDPNAAEKVFREAEDCAREAAALQNDAGERWKAAGTHAASAAWTLRAGAEEWRAEGVGGAFVFFYTRRQTAYMQNAVPALMNGLRAPYDGLCAAAAALGALAGKLRACTAKRTAAASDARLCHFARLLTFGPDAPAAPAGRDPLGLWEALTDAIPELEAAASVAVKRCGAAQSAADELSVFCRAAAEHVFPESGSPAAPAGASVLRLMEETASNVEKAVRTDEKR